MIDEAGDPAIRKLLLDIPGIPFHISGDDGDIPEPVPLLPDEAPDLPGHKPYLLPGLLRPDETHCLLLSRVNRPVIPQQMRFQKCQRMVRPCKPGHSLPA